VACNYAKCPIYSMGACMEIPTLLKLKRKKSKYYVGSEFI
jgi:hypothetical protein